MFLLMNPYCKASEKGAWQIASVTRAKTTVYIGSMHARQSRQCRSCKVQ